MMQHVRNRHDLECFVLKWKSFTIVRCYLDLRDWLHEDVDADDTLRSQPARHFGSDCAITRADIEERIGRARKLRERVDDSLRTRNLNSLAVNFVKRASKNLHEICL